MHLPGTRPAKNKDRFSLVPCTLFDNSPFTVVWDEFSQNGRRRGMGLVSRDMADQFMKSVCNRRNKELSNNLPGLRQGEE
jgi:hypothetical protein